MTIENKIVAITGAGRGIGRATAIHLAARGAHLVLGSRSKAEVAAVVGEIEATGGKAIYLPIDVSKRSDLKKLVNLACERFGRLDVIINNAGIGPLSRFACSEYLPVFLCATKREIDPISAEFPVPCQTGWEHSQALFTARRQARA